MAILKHEVKLSPEQVAEYNTLENSYSALSKFVFEIACKSSHHPYGYDFFRGKVVEEDGELYAVWSSYSTCD